MSSLMLGGNVGLPRRRQRSGNLALTGGAAGTALQEQVNEPEVPTETGLDLEWLSDVKLRPDTGKSKLKGSRKNKSSILQIHRC